MQLSSLSRSRINCSIRSVNRTRQRLESASQSALLGVRFAGNSANA
jgi:hypothetical protein